MSEEKKNRIATVVIHGMGEQTPMGTMSDFVKSFLAYEEYTGNLCPGQNYFSVPSDLSKSYEVQKWIVKETKYRPRVDFFELYWAPLMADNKFSHVFPWMKKVLFMFSEDSRLRRLKFVFLLVLALIPLISFGFVAGLYDICVTFDKVVAHMNYSLFFICLIGVIFLSSVRVNAIKYSLIVGIFGFSVYGFYAFFHHVINEGNSQRYIVLGSLLMTAYIFKFTGKFIKDFLADAARYFEPEPVNIDNRERIRKLGVDLLEQISKDDDYDRIILVSHSLGSAVGYDVLRLYWAKNGNRYKLSDYETKIFQQYKSFSSMVLSGEDGKACVTNLNKELEEIKGSKLFEQHNKTNDEVTIQKLTRNGNKFDWYQYGQHRLFNELKNIISTTDIKDVNYKWKVSDFITMGSPLSKMKTFYSDGSNNQQWVKRLERTLLSNPPTPDLVTDQYYFVKSKAQEKTDGNPASAAEYLLHHGALFAFTRWTNIYHEADYIGGEIGGEIGKGTKDVKLSPPVTNPRYAFWLWMRNRTPLMHNHYWTSQRHRKTLDSDSTDKKIMSNPLIKESFKNDIAIEAIAETFDAMHLYNIERLDEVINCDE